MLTRLFKTEGKRGKEGKRKRPSPHGDNRVTSVVTHKLTSGTISLPSQT